MAKRKRGNSDYETEELHEGLTFSEREDQQWLVKSILKERRRNGIREFQIRWEDDPDTGRSFPSEWVRPPALGRIHC